MSRCKPELDRLLSRLPPVSLEELDERASLLRRTDNKYVLGDDAFMELLERLTADHQVLDIEGRREFAYESVYFDTPDLRCFRDHVAGRCRVSKREPGSTETPAAACSRSS